MAGPARQQRLQDARRRALADRHAAGDTDDERNARRIRTEERGRRRVQVARRADIEIQQPRQRQIDVCHLVKRHALVDADQATELRLGQRQRCGRTQLGPLGPRKLDKTGNGDLPCSERSRGACSERARRASRGVAHSLRNIDTAIVRPTPTTT